MTEFEVNTSVIDEEIVINEFDALELENSTPEAEPIITPSRPNAFLRGLENSQEEDQNNSEEVIYFTFFIHWWGGYFFSNFKQLEVQIYYDSRNRFYLEVLNNCIDEYKILLESHFSAKLAGDRNLKILAVFSEERLNRDLFNLFFEKQKDFRSTGFGGLLH